uniref:(northern house mosquito) hypothetical protein n=1 Tax=Culex pipiens TaxID=7175 RepID=A0A8D8DBB4_CULPI
MRVLSRTGPKGCFGSRGPAKSVGKSGTNFSTKKASASAKRNPVFPHTIAKRLFFYFFAFFDLEQLKKRTGTRFPGGAIGRGTCRKYTPKHRPGQNQNQKTQKTRSQFGSPLFKTENFFLLFSPLPSPSKSLPASSEHDRLSFAVGWLVGCCFGFDFKSERDGLRHTQYGGGFLAWFVAGCRRGMER